MKQKHFLLTALFASALSLAGCSGLGANAYNNERSIASDMNSYNLNNITQTSDDGTFSAQVGNMEGMDTIWTYDAENETSTELSYDITLYSGKLKLTLISPDKKVTTLVNWIPKKMQKTSPLLHRIPPPALPHVSIRYGILLPGTRRKPHQGRRRRRHPV